MSTLLIQVQFFSYVGNLIHQLLPYLLQNTENDEIDRNKCIERG